MGRRASAPSAAPREAIAAALERFVGIVLRLGHMGWCYREPVPFSQAAEPQAFLFPKALGVTD